MKQNLRFRGGYCPKRIQPIYLLLLVLLLTGVGGKGAFGQDSAQQTPPDTTKTIRDTLTIEEVTINTGYQTIPKERATGSFVFLDSSIINRGLSSNILDRIDGLVNGVLFDKRDGNDPKVQIRGLYTLRSEIAKPLIVLNDFPYDGDITDINPNDVESISILRDAAAASIWGARAGNGVIVIKTKTGKLNQRSTVKVTSNLTLQEKPDLWGLPVIPSTDYIGLEKYLFANEYRFGDTLNRLYPAFTPVYELLFQQRGGSLPVGEVERRIDELGAHDVRSDYLRYLYRRGMQQQHALNIAGGGNNTSYFYSAGLDRELSNLVGDESSRSTFRSDHSLSLFDKLTLRIGTQFSAQRSNDNSPGGYGAISMNGRGLPPYARLANQDGRPAEVDLQYRKIYTDTAGGGKLLDWKYRPLEELDNLDNRNTSRMIQATFSADYKWSEAFSTEVRYQYQYSNASREVNSNIHLYGTRNLINQYTQRNAAGALSFPVPRGDIFDKSGNIQNGHSGRVQANYQLNRSAQALSVIGGAEIRQSAQASSSFRTYGFDQLLNVTAVDYVTQYSTYDNLLGRRAIPMMQDFGEITNRYVSAYVNGSYTLLDRYTASFSARNDASNIFGVKTNQKWKPLWSTGLLWHVSNESFYPSSSYPKLRFRVTYGASGNIDPSASALTRIRYNAAATQITNLPSASILGAPNPRLRWEQVNTLNLGLDMSDLKGRWRISLEYYDKRSRDVLGNEPLDATTGVATVVTNSAHIDGRGMDLNVNLDVIKRHFLSWQTTLNASWSSYGIKRYLAAVNQIGYTSDGSVIGFLEGHNPYTIVSYRWAGLDAGSGNPQGLIDGQPSKDYRELVRLPLENQVISGPALPPYFGNMFNQLQIGHFSISANISYRFGHFYRRPTVVYNTLFSGASMHADFVDRWQQPGDETRTQVPSMVYPAILDRDNFYRNSEATVESASVIRLEDVRCQYNYRPKGTVSRFVTQVSCYAYFSNLNAILWKAGNSGTDPDFRNGLVPANSMALGIKLDF